MVGNNTHATKIQASSRNQDGLVLVVDQHVLVGIVHNGKHVRGHLSPSLPSEVRDHFIRVNGQSSVRIDCHAEETRVSLLREKTLFSINFSFNASKSLV